MSNTLLTIDMITRESLRVAHESCQFIKTTDRQYDDSFAQTGAKIGTALRVRKPEQFVRTTGTRVMDVQDQVERAGTITVATQDHVDMRVNSVELAMSIDDFSKRKIEPAVKTLVSAIEADYLAFAAKATYQLVGTDNTAITTLDVPGKARAKLNQQLAPKSDRSIQMDSVTMGSLVNGMAAYFNPSGAVGKQYTEGLVARTAMADYYENERVWTMTNGSDVAFALDTYTVTEGDADLTVTSWATPVAGMVFTLAGVYDVHPETKTAYSHLKQFTVLAGSTATNLLISPAIYSSASGALQNVSAMPTTTAVGTCFGTASKSYVQPLMYHKEAFQFVTADLPLMGGAHQCARRVQDGLSMRVWMDGDIRNDEMLMRIDILYGMAALRPEWACRLSGLYNA
ncbi:MAG: hypothetical protein IPG91_19430 [Ideonella sp.]|nr:hypothetical protein [Ideonella sp.]